MTLQFINTAAVFCFAFICVEAGHSQEKYTLEERLVPGTQYHVSNRVQVTGQLTLPHEKNRKKVPQITVTGKSAIEYDERVLSVDDSGAVDRTIRYYDQLTFARKVGNDEQANALRDEVRRLVILRKKQMEVAFSPDGPLTWGELDLIRTDVFTPALDGLFPKNRVGTGATWSASTAAIRELTDLNDIESGQLTCRFKNILVLANRRHARVDLNGSVFGFGDDGKTEHQLSGYFYFDLDRGHLSYLYVNGKQLLFGENKTVLGRIQGTFVLTRYPNENSDALADEKLRTLTLQPNETNTLLLFDSSPLGVRFLHPRRWRVSSLGNDRQLVVEEPHGNGFLITVESLDKTPTASSFHKEVRDWLNKKKATILEENRPSSFTSGIEHFDFTAKLDEKKTKLDYYVVRQANGGATVAARFTSASEDWRPLQREVQQMVRSMKIRRAGNE